MDVDVDSSGGLQLSWGPVAAADSYQVVLGTPPLINVIPQFNGTSASTSKVLSGLNKGIDYVWRVRAWNPGGYGPWSADLPFRTRPLASAELQAPADGASGVAPKPFVTFAWKDRNPLSTMPGMPGGMPLMPNTYRFQVSTDPSFPDVPPPIMPGFPPTAPYLVDHTVSGKTGTIDQGDTAAVFAFGKTYYWRVKITSGGSTSDWSPTASFTTILPPPTTITLLAPAPGAINLPDLPTLKWTDSNRPTITIMPAMPPIPAPYWLRIATDSTFPDVAPMPVGMPQINTPPYVYNASVSDTTATPASSLQHGRKYYWRVMVQESNNGNGSFASGSFTVIPDAPDAPVHATPADEAINVPLTAGFSWHPGARAALYRLQISTDILFQDADSIRESTTPDTTFTAHLPAGRTLFWRVRSENGGGNSLYAPVRSLNTEPPVPAAPVLIDPRNDSVDVSEYAVLSWQASAGASSYHVQISGDAGFSSLQVDDSGANALFYSPPSLERGSAYYWRVRAKNAGGAGEWSETRKFTVRPPAPYAPYPVYPPPGITNVTLSPVIAWNKVPFAAYDMQVDADSAFANPIDSRTGLTDTTLAIGPLDPARTYYWRVRASNSQGQSAWLPPMPFTTRPNPPAAPALLAPDSNAQNLPDTVTLKWASVPGASAYTLKVTKTVLQNGVPAFFVIDSVVTTDTVRHLGPLDKGTLYLWGVNARNAGGESQFNVRSFTTKPDAPGPASLASPSVGDTVRTDSVTLAWHAPATAMRYRLEVSLDSAFGTSVVDSNLLDTSKVIRYATPNGGRYWWRVQAWSLGGGWGAYGEARWFIVVAPPVSLAGGLRVTPGVGGAGAMLRYALADAARVQVRLFDPHGRLRAMPVDGPQGAGPHSVDLGAALPSRGWYWLRFETLPGPGRQALREERPIFLGR
jgi:hypothetical protein